MQAIVAFVVVLSLIAGVSCLGWYRTFKAFSEYRASVVTQTRLIQEKTAAVLKQKEEAIQHANKDYNEALEKLRLDNDAAIKRVQSLARRCPKRVPEATEASDSTADAAGPTDEGMEQLLKLNRMIEQCEDINRSYILTREALK